jgi:HD superfamily phosphohydrolase
MISRARLERKECKPDPGLGWIRPSERSDDACKARSTAMERETKEWREAVVEARVLVDIPEIAALDSTEHVIRIAPEVNVPVTDRVLRIIDTAAFRRLAKISQLGLVALIYPSATHTRFEHSLGVYRRALLFVRQLARDPRFRAVVDPAAVELFIVAALLHDIGHWPYCHPIEDLRLEGQPRHEDLARARLTDEELAELLDSDWNLAATSVADLLAGRAVDPRERVLHSMLSGPIDVDKLDYLARDSLHAGVPYGHHFDENRLIGSLCINGAGDGIAITEKGKTAAELIVFARYVMFSEVYWHHGVRAATAMLQRAWFELRARLDPTGICRLGDDAWATRLLDVSASTPIESLVDGLFGPRRRLYKRVAQYSTFDDDEIWEALAHRPFAELVEVADEFGRRASSELGIDARAPAILIDAPPVAKEVEFRLEVQSTRDGRYRRLDEVSPVVRSLAKEQFDTWVKRVRVFARSDIASRLADWPRLRAALAEAAESRR